MNDNEFGGGKIIIGLALIGLMFCGFAGLKTRNDIIRQEKIQLANQQADAIENGQLKVMGWKWFPPTTPNSNALLIEGMMATERSVNGFHFPKWKVGDKLTVQYYQISDPKGPLQTIETFIASINPLGEVLVKDANITDPQNFLETEPGTTSAVITRNMSKSLGYDWYEIGSQLSYQSHRDPEGMSRCGIAYVQFWAIGLENKLPDQKIRRIWQTDLKGKKFFIYDSTAN